VLVLMIILAFCLLYQMRTILIQKRIDRLRQEFMKNMIYEMKQPPSVGTILAEKATKIGNTDFFYSLNELRIGNERVIITSRQAEILKLLTDTPNEVVSRTDILNQIWGDDSYANSMALNVQITYLRRALKSDESVSIEAVMKKGYVLKEQQL
jgi:two-component system phosphate regulon sensor histidine kinase PhoR